MILLQENIQQMIAQQTIVAGSIILKIIGVIIFGLGNDYTVKKIMYDGVDVYSVTATKFEDQLNISMFIIYRDKHDYYDQLMIFDKAKKMIHNITIDTNIQLRYNVVNDHIAEYSVVYNVSAQHATTIRA